MGEAEQHTVVGVAHDADKEEQEIKARGAGEKWWYVLFICLTFLSLYALLTCAFAIRGCSLMEDVCLGFPGAG